MEIAYYKLKNIFYFFKGKEAKVRFISHRKLVIQRKVFISLKKDIPGNCRNVGRLCAGGETAFRLPAAAAQFINFKFIVCSVVWLYSYGTKWKLIPVDSR